jgi:hypothetical protein
MRGQNPGLRQRGEVGGDAFDGDGTAALRRSWRVGVGKQERTRGIEDGEVFLYVFSLFEFTEDARYAALGWVHRGPPAWEM